MDVDKILVTTNHRVKRFVEYFSNLTDKHSKLEENDPYQKELQLKITRLRELIVILSLYEDRIKYFAVDSNRIIPCSLDDKERIQFTDCNVQLVVQIRRQSFSVIPVLYQHYSNARNQQEPPFVNVEFRLRKEYPNDHTRESLSVKISKTHNFSTVKESALQNLLEQQLANESSATVVYNALWSVTFFLHVLDTFNDTDTILRRENSAQLIAQLVSPNPHHLSSSHLLNDVLTAKRTAIESKVRHRKKAVCDHNFAHLDPTLFDAKNGVFLVSPKDLVPSVFDQSTANELFQTLTSFQIPSCDSRPSVELTLHLESEKTNCFNFGKHFLVRHRKDYSAFALSENASSIRYRVTTVFFDLSTLLTLNSEIADFLKQVCDECLSDDALKSLSQTLKIDLPRGCQFVSHVHFEHRFVGSRLEFLLVSEAFPGEDNEFCSLVTLARTFSFHDSGLSLDLRYNFLERILIGLAHLHKTRFPHGRFDAKKVFVSSAGMVKIYDVFFESVMNQLIPSAINLFEAQSAVSFTKIQRSFSRSAMMHDIYNFGSFVLSLWTDCQFQSVFAFDMPDSQHKNLRSQIEEKQSRLNSALDVAHFVNECFKIYYGQTDLQLGSLLNHAFILEWQKKTLLEKSRKRQNSELVSIESLPSNENNITSSYNRSQHEFFFVRLLGKGGFGKVYMVRNNVDGTEYALKRVPLRDSHDRSNLRREVSHLARLVHPNVVRYYSSWFEESSNSSKVFENELFGDELDDEEDDDDEFGEDDEYDENDEDNYSSSSEDNGIDNDLDISFRCNSNIEDSFVHFENSNGSSHSQSTASENDSIRTLSKSVRKKSHKSNSKSDRKKGETRLPDMLCIQMELCDANTLTDKIRNGIFIEEPALKYRILHEITSALQYIHSMDIIHRDLKPSNIFFVGQRVKVGDFGLARTSRSDVNDPNITASTDSGGNFRKISTFGSSQFRKMKKVSASNWANTLQVGTAHYMAPEVTRDAHYNQKIDIYSLGVIFFELFYPMNTMTERAKVLGKIQPTETGPINFPTECSRYFRPIEIEFLQKLLSFSPADRPTAEDLLNSSIFNFEEYKEDAAAGSSASFHDLDESSSIVPLKHLKSMVSSLLENSTSPQFLYTVQSLINRSMPVLNSISYEYEIEKYRSDENLFKFNLIRTDFERMASLFGSMSLQNQSFMSVVEESTTLGDDSVKLCDERGVVCNLPCDQRIVLARNVAFRARDSKLLWCRSFAPVFRKSLDGPYHPRMFWTASFDQIWSNEWSEQCVLPFCELLTFSTRFLCPILSKGIVIYHITSLQLLQTIFNHINLPQKLFHKIVGLLRDNGEKVLNQNIDELKFGFQLMFNVFEMPAWMPNFLFDLLKISSTSPGDLLRDIEAKCQEFSVVDTKKLLASLSGSVRELEQIMNLHGISAAHSETKNNVEKIDFRFSLSLLTNTPVSYELIVLHVVYQDIETRKSTLIGIGGQFSGVIDTHQTMIQQVQLSDLQSKSSNAADLSTGSRATRALSLHSSGERTDPVRITPLTSFAEKADKKMALGVTFSIDKLSRLEWDVKQSSNGSGGFSTNAQNGDFLVDVLIVSTMPTIFACKTAQIFRVSGLRVLMMPELSARSIDTRFNQLVSPTNPHPDLPSILEYGTLVGTHFILLIDAWKPPEAHLKHQFSVLELNNDGTFDQHYFFGENAANQGYLMGSAISGLNQASKRQLLSVLRVLQSDSRDQIPERRTSRSLSESTSPTQPKSSEDVRNSTGVSRRSSSESQAHPALAVGSFRPRRKMGHQRSGSVKTPRGRTSSEHSLLRGQRSQSRGGSPILNTSPTNVIAPEEIDIAFVTGSRSLDRASATAQVLEFLGNKLHFLVRGSVSNMNDNKLKVLVTKSLPFSLLRNLADSATSCFTDLECPLSCEHSTCLYTPFFTMLAELKTRNRSNADILEKVGQKLWAWVDAKCKNRPSGGEHSVIILLHLDGRSFRYRLVQLDFN